MAGLETEPRMTWDMSRLMIAGISYRETPEQLKEISSIEIEILRLFWKHGEPLNPVAKYLYRGATENIFNYIVFSAAKGDELWASTPNEFRLVIDLDSIEEIFELLSELSRRSEETNHWKKIRESLEPGRHAHHRKAGDISVGIGSLLCTLFPFQEMNHRILMLGSVDRLRGKFVAAQAYLNDLHDFSYDTAGSIFSVKFAVPKN